MAQRQHANPMHDEKEPKLTVTTDDDDALTNSVSAATTESQQADDDAFIDTKADLTHESQQRLIDQEKAEKLAIVLRSLAQLTDANVDHQTQYTQALVGLFDSQVDAAINKEREAASAHNNTVQPDSFHQATIYFALLPQEQAAEFNLTRWVLAFLSFGMVTLQCVCAAAIVFSTAHPSCLTNFQCRMGMYCRGSEVSGLRNRCSGCGNTGPQIELNRTSGERFNRGPNYGGETYYGYNGSAVLEHCAQSSQSVAHINWCSACADSATGQVSLPYLLAYNMGQNVGAMATADWVAYLLASLIVALMIGAELRDMFLHQVAIRRAPLAPRGWAVYFSVLEATRRFVFLPLVVTCMLSQVAVLGGDAQSVLFLLEVDNVVYSVGLPENLKGQVETHWQIMLRETEQQELTQLKTVHIPLIALEILLSARFVQSYHTYVASRVVQLVFPFFPFLIGGIVEKCSRTYAVTNGDMFKVLRTAAHVLLQCFGGMLMNATLTVWMNDFVVG